MPVSEIESWLSRSAVQMAEMVQGLTLNAPPCVRAAMKPGEVDHAIVSRLIRIYGIQPANLVSAA